MSDFTSDSGNVRASSDNTVIRTTNYWSPATHNLLLYLEKQGFAYSPRHLGLDSQDSAEKLSLIAGESGKETWARVAIDEGIIRFAKLLRAYHDTIQSYRPTGKILWAYGEQELQPDEIICHNDFGPWNTVWRDDTPIGIIDWDLAGPGKPIDDIAYALEYVAPFRSDEEALKWLGYTAPPDRKHRVGLFMDSYGSDFNDSIVDEVIRIQTLDIEHVKYLASRGLEPQKTWLQNGTLDELQRRIDWTRQNRHLFE